MKFLGFTITSNQDVSSRKRMNNRVDKGTIERDAELDLRKDGSTYIRAGAEASSSIFDFDTIAKSETDLMLAYRRISHIPEVAKAIDEIINEMIVIEEDRPPVILNTDDLSAAGVSQKVIDAIREEFESVLLLLDFPNEAYNVIRTWYTDSRIVYEKKIDVDHPELGLVGLNKLDPRKVRKVKEVDELEDGRVIVVDEYYVYLTQLANPNNTGFQNFTVEVGRSSIEQFNRMAAFKLRPDCVTYVDSGLVDMSTGITFGHLHKAVKVANQLDMIESSLIVYRLARSSERRAVYVDVGNLPPAKAQQVVEETKRAFRNKVQYDAVKGEITERNRVMALQEDYFLARRGGQRSTEIDTLSAGENLGNIEDVLFFMEKLYNSLNIPVSRFKDGTALFTQSGSTIARDELKFTRFVTRLRAQFTHLFDDLLRTQLVLKGVIEEDEWEEMRRALKYEFAHDNHYTELKDLEIMNLRVQAANELKAYVGDRGYYSHDWMMRKVFAMTDEEIDDQREKREKEKGLYGDIDERTDAELGVTDDQLAAAKLEIDAASARRRK